MTRTLSRPPNRSTGLSSAAERRQGQGPEVVAGHVEAGLVLDDHVQRLPVVGGHSPQEEGVDVPVARRGEGQWCDPRRPHPRTRGGSSIGIWWFRAHAPARRAGRPLRAAQMTGTQTPRGRALHCRLLRKATRSAKALGAKARSNPGGMREFASGSRLVMAARGTATSRPSMVATNTRSPVSR